MIQLRHNGRESSRDADAFASIGDAIARYTGDLGGPRSVLTRLCIDGREIPEGEWDAESARAFGAIHALEIESAPIEEIALRSLHGACEYAPQVREALAQVADRMRCGETSRACALFAVSLDALSVVMFAVDAACTHAGHHAATLAGLEGALEPWLGRLADAQERGDWITVADLLEFELLPLLDDWIARLGEVGQRLRETVAEGEVGAMGEENR